MPTSLSHHFNSPTSSSASTTKHYGYPNNSHGTHQQSSRRRNGLHKNERNGGISSDGIMLSLDDGLSPPEPDYKRFLREFFHKEPCVYSHEVRLCGFGWRFTGVWHGWELAVQSWGIVCRVMFNHGPTWFWDTFSIVLPSALPNDKEIYIYNIYLLHMK